MIYAIATAGRSLKNAMGNKITDKKMITDIARRIGVAESAAEKTCEAFFFEEILQNLEQCRTVTVKKLGTFYIKATEPTRTFKFNPSRRLRKILGWSIK